VTGVVLEHFASPGAAEDATRHTARIRRRGLAFAWFLDTPRRAPPRLPGAAGCPGLSVRQDLGAFGSLETASLQFALSCA